MTSTFVIPLNREDLLSPDTPGQYSVQEVVNCDRIARRLADCNAALSDDGFLFILNHFDPLFSVVHQSREVDTKCILTSHNIVLKGMTGMIQSLKTLMENMDTHQREKLLNAAKMYLFLMFELLRSLEERFNLKTEKDLAVDVKSRKKAIKNFIDFDWDEKRNISLMKLLEFIHQPLPKLWEPPVADEEFVRIAADCCYKILEDPQVSQSRLSYIKQTIFEILGALIQKYGHGLSCTVKIVQLMKLYDHLPETLAQAVVKFVKDFQSRNFLREVLREITESETSFEGSSPKAYSHFLVEVARLDSEVILPSMPLLLPELGSDSYMMRNCVLGVVGEVVAGSLTMEHLSEEQKEMRDSYFEYLEDFLNDTNASVRGKVLKIWQKLCQEKAIPLARQSQLLERTVHCLSDMSWNVTRSAVQLYQSLLQSNPFGDKLAIQTLKDKLQSEEDKLALLEKEINSKVPPTRAEKWKEVSPKLILVLQEALSSSEEVEDIPEEAKAKSVADNVDHIFHCLENEKYLEAFCYLKYTEKNSGNKKSRSERNLEWQVDYFHDLFHKIFVQLDVNSEDSIRKEGPEYLAPEQREAKETLLKQQLLTQYFKDCTVFVEQLEKATEIISSLLFCAQPTVIIDALEYLTAAYQFGLNGALTGVRHMLVLVWSSESSVKDGVAAAYRRMYLDIAPHVSGRIRAAEIVKNLCVLLKTLDEDQQAALEVLVREWMKNGDMEKDCIQVMWERFSMKLPDTSDNDSRAALSLLAMVGGAAPIILRSNIPVLISVGLGERGRKDSRLAKETCQALLKLVAETSTVTSDEEAFRLSKDDELFEILCSLLTDGFNSLDDENYIGMASEAIDVLYQLSENPDKICSSLLKKFITIVIEASSQEAFDNLLQPSENKEADKTKGKNCPIPEELLNRLVFYIGHIAFRQWVHLDKSVFRELKRRNRIREVEAEKKRGDNHKNRNKDKRKSQANLNSSFLSRASETPRLKKDKEDAADAEIGEVNADDAEADYINHVCETEIVTGEGLLAYYTPLVVNVCSNPQRYLGTRVCSIACIALAKLMVLSSTFAEEHLSLVFTMMEKSDDPKIRSDLVYAVGDLANRFPNLIEPWTKHLYMRLHDKSSKVRLDTVVVLKHLITNEMVKVRGQISAMAQCIVDENETISVMASQFFQDLSKKGNTLYNVLPDIISRLSNSSTDESVSEDHFHVIFEFLLPLIQKDKQMESLVEKLCHRFRASTSERQWSDIAFCLSLLQYSDRSLRRLTENFQCYFDKLNSPKVYEAFETIIAQAIKTNKPERKLLAEELQAKIDDCMKKGLGAEGGAEQPEDEEDSNVDIDESSQKENRVSINRRVNKRNETTSRNSIARRKVAAHRRGRRKSVEKSSDEEDDDSSDEDVDEAIKKVQEANRKRRR